RRNGYRTRRWDTRVGTIDLRIPKLREGTYFPDWLLDARTRAERAFVQCVAEAYVRGVSTRRVEGLVETLGIASLSKSQVSEIAKDLDELVDDFRNRRLDRGPYTYVWADALFLKVREGGRVVNVALLHAVGVNGDGHREILGLELSTAEDGAGWLSFWRGAGRSGPFGCADGRLRRPHRACGGDPGHAAGSSVAEMQDALHAQPVDQSAESRPADGRDHGPDHLRSTRPRFGVGPAPPRRRPARDSRLLRRRHPPRRGRCRPVGVHRFSQRALASDLVQQPPGAAQPGDTAPHRRSWDLPHPGVCHPPRRSGNGRTR